MWQHTYFIFPTHDGSGVDYMLFTLMALVLSVGSLGAWHADGLGRGFLAWRGVGCVPGAVGLGVVGTWAAAGGG